MTKSKRQRSRGFEPGAVRLLGKSGKNISQVQGDPESRIGNVRCWQREFASDGGLRLPATAVLHWGRNVCGGCDARTISCNGTWIAWNSCGHLLLPKQMRLRWVEEHRDAFQVTRMCRVAVEEKGMYNRA